MVNPVFLYYPNLVGYSRIAFTVAAFWLCFTNPQVAALFYLIGQGLDAVDGTVARAYGQTSKFGAVLDMLTDRMSTATLLVVLSHQYPMYWGLFAFLIVLDIVSHWFQMYAKLSSGATSHKGSANPLLDFYYTFPYALLVFCVGNEFFLVALYLLPFWAGPSFVIAGAKYSLVTVLAYITFPIFFGKQFMNFVQLYDAAGEIAALDLQAATAIKPSGNLSIKTPTTPVARKGTKKSL